MISTLKVSLGDTVIGTLTMLPAGSVFFAFSEEYLNDANRPVLSQSFLTETGEVIPESKATRVQLPAFFSNLLPEGHICDMTFNEGEYADHCAISRREHYKAH
jgi:serine/threonine-protein kinase HipA